MKLVATFTFENAAQLVKAVSTAIEYSGRDGSEISIAITESQRPEAIPVVRLFEGTLSDQSTVFNVGISG